MKKFILFISIIVCVQHISAQDSSKHTRINKSLTIYTDVFRQLDINYVDTLNYDDLSKTSINAMLRKIDPYTVYIPESETDDLRFMTTGAYAGIGAIISQRNGNVYVSSPYEGMPAQKNDVRAGDIILEVDGKSVKGKTVSEVSVLLKGKPHDKITLLLERHGERRAIKREFERENIQINPVSYTAKITDDIGYISLNEFTDKAATEFKANVRRLVSEHNINSLIIDLRENGGGIIDEAVKIVGFFVPKGTEVVSTKGASESSSRTYKTTTEPIFPELRVAILINRSSASASEIVAGAFQDLDRGVLIGERTFGKGLVQSIKPITHSGHLKVTTAKYYIPSGRCIQAIDYSHKNEDGSIARVPDSLTTVFYTRNGRTVRDGGGVSPDIDIKIDEGVNITYYIYLKNLHFDFATIYAATHESIAPASTFSITEKELKDFEAFLKEKEFTYTTETEKYFKQLRELAEIEGRERIAKEEFDALAEKLKPNISEEFSKNSNAIKDMLNMEIIKRYYYQKGEIEYSLKNNEELQKAIEILSDENIYKKTLNNK